ncbi:MAG: undecaprenyl-diphosphate phosphatase [Myxococcales bacterium]|nr:undecaprenyl-diphosphate phosphatase [Myxococcales bacterium]
MEAWKAAVLGLVEGITEYLPVSSTGHLILAGWLLGLHDPAHKEAMDAFDIVVQGGAILAVLGLYAARVRSMLFGLIGRDPAGLRLLGLLLVAFVPAAVMGLLLHDLLESLLFHPIPVLLALGLGGVLMIGLDWSGVTKRGERTIEDMGIRDAVIVGCFQCLALWPGTSRSMSTIAGGTITGLRARDAAEFSFLLGLPTLGSATAYSLLKNLKHAHDDGTPNLFDLLGFAPVALGIAVAAVSAWVAVKWLVAFLGRHGLAPFGWYRLALTAALGVAMAVGAVTL